jgi:hypothetical protein
LTLNFWLFFFLYLKYSPSSSLRDPNCTHLNLTIPIHFPGTTASGMIFLSEFSWMRTTYPVNVPVLALNTLKSLSVYISLYLDDDLFENRESLLSCLIQYLTHNVQFL